ncbi:thioredoxin 1 [Plasmopara halstedii]|uniref:Thioredoxin 1 n=1 Tax=Plasmopara halstedii TaxID=4781 RepID=A0A0P1ANT9_PLAHL|nr:thioredoxin 1 [Plasmopara halstedii]CEG43169.1 thioredoxin 1 [Plasmopara halstedii]|eukprot:XP_024579538.1 thioredoxin 1 [Plasmopara halstedii]
MGVTTVHGDSDWNSQMQSAGGKLVVVDFSAVWCGPCQHIKPVYHQLSDQYHDVVFLEVDEAQNRSLIGALGVRGFPTFHFYVSQNKVDELVGADPNQLRAKIEQWRQSAYNPFASPGMTLGASSGSSVKPMSAAEAREARLKRFNNVSLVPDVPMPSASVAAAKPAVPDSNLVCDPNTGTCRPLSKDDRESDQMKLPPVNEDLLTQLKEMGFNDLHCQKALLATDNQGLEVAINWLGDHQDDEDINEPIKFVDMSEMTRAVTPEEKAAKVEELKARIAKKRAEREEQEKVDQRVNELKRRTEGQGLLEAREEIEAIQRKVAAEKMKKDKEDAKRERERLRKQLEMDKRERQARGGRLGGPPIDVAPVEISEKMEEEKVKGPVLTPKENITKNVGILKKYRVGNDGLTALKTLDVYVKNLIEKPEEEKFRTINLVNPAFRKRVASLAGGVALLKSLGYAKDETDGNLKLSVDKRDVELLKYAHIQLQGAIAELTH